MRTWIWLSRPSTTWTARSWTGKTHARSATVIHLFYFISRFSFYSILFEFIWLSCFVNWDFLFNFELTIFISIYLYIDYSASDQQTQLFYWINFNKWRMFIYIKLFLCIIKKLFVIYDVVLFFCTWTEQFGLNNLRQRYLKMSISRFKL